MEEVDQLIIYSLKDIGCELDDDIVTIGEIESGEVVRAVVKCLKVIYDQPSNPSQGTTKEQVDELPLSLPASMSARVSLCAKISQAIKDLGYRDDLGYHQLLYPNAADNRKMLHFLTTLLPRPEVSQEQSQAAESSGKFGAQNVLQSLIEDEISIIRKEVWVPSFSNQNWAHRRQYSAVCYLHAVGIEQPFVDPAAGLSREDSTAKIEEIKSSQEFITKQVPNRQDVAPSILEANFSQYTEAKEREEDWNKYGLDSGLNPTQFQQKKLGKILSQMKDHIRYSLKESEEILAKEYEEADRKIRGGSKRSGFATLVDFSQEKTEHVVEETEEEVKQRREEELADLEKQLQELKNQILTTRKECETFESNIRQLEASLASEALKCKKLAEEHRIQKKIFEYLPNAEENIKTLQNISQESANNLLTLANEWEATRLPLLQKFRQLRESRTGKDSSSKGLLAEIKKMREEMKQIIPLIQQKEAEYNEMVEAFRRLPKNVNRAVYTKRILEIVKQVKKQKVDINKILIDTKALKKEISSNMDALNRSFALTTEIVFKDAKKDVTAKQAYKDLVAIHEKFEELSNCVSESGAKTNEVLELEEKLQQASVRAGSLDLDTIKNDLKQIQEENKKLVAQMQT